MGRRSHLALLVLVLLVADCARPPSTRAFYFWRTRFALSAAERDVLGRAHVQRLYVRLFDVAWDGSAAPRAPITFTEKPPAGIEVVPVVYVVNDVFVHEPDPAALAERTWSLVRGIARNASITFHELQVDCDWSDGTRDRYFAFCRRLKQLGAAEHVALSATVRLHQVKYASRTGVPPVDRGMLMFYNMGRLAPDNERLSIYDTADAERYARFIDRYPLPLDAALPIFSWAVHVRAGRIVGLLEKPDVRALGAALRADGPRRFVAAQPAFVSGTYLQEGDALTIEAVTPALAREAAATLARHFHPRHEFTLTLFDLDERNLDAYAPADLDALYAAVR